MTDLERTKLCAEAMGYAGEGISDHWGGIPIFASEVGVYDPLHDDAQAMALVKKCGLLIESNGTPCTEWRVSIWIAPMVSWFHAEGENLNRAIVECVAQMQLERTKPAQSSGQSADNKLKEVG